MEGFQFKKVWLLWHGWVLKESKWHFLLKECHSKAIFSSFWCFVALTGTLKILIHHEKIVGEHGRTTGVLCCFYTFCIISRQIWFQCITGFAIEKKLCRQKKSRRSNFNIKENINNNNLRDDGLGYSHRLPSLNFFIVSFDIFFIIARWHPRRKNVENYRVINYSELIAKVVCFSAMLPMKSPHCKNCFPYPLLNNLETAFFILSRHPSVLINLACRQLLKRGYRICCFSSHHKIFLTPTICSN